MKWYAHQDRDPELESIESYTLTTNPDKEGWNTDSGYAGYGLPKELAQWICDILNQSGKKCPYEQDRFGLWVKVKK